MDRRRLGQLHGEPGPEVSVIGFGAWPIGGGMGDVSETSAIAAVRAAIDSGQTLIDTAEMYRLSESRIGKALSGGYRDRAFLVTKVNGGSGPAQVLTALENSLRALETEYVDLYQIHWPSEAPTLERQVETLLELQHQGKARCIGVSNFSVAELERAWSVGPFQSLQPVYNLFDRGIEREIVPWCRAHGIAILAHSALAKGLLAGKYRPGHVFSADDERSRSKRFQGVEGERYFHAAQRLSAIAERKGLTLPQLAIGWTLRLPEVAMCLVGAKSMEQVLANNGGQGWSLSPGEIDEIETILSEPA